MSEPDWAAEKCRIWSQVGAVFSLSAHFRVRYPVKDIVPRSYVCPRVNPAMPVDVDSGDVRLKAWEHAEWTEPFVDIEGDKKPLPWCVPSSSPDPRFVRIPWLSCVAKVSAKHNRQQPDTPAQS
eukprot:3726341-Rhodomonas_salina.1